MSLAVLPVVGSLVFIFRSLGLSYHEVNIALIPLALAKEGSEKVECMTTSVPALLQAELYG